MDKLGCKTMKLAHILKSKPEVYKAYFPSGASKMQFSTAPPTAIIYKFYWPGAMGQAPMSSPGFINPFMPGDLVDQCRLDLSYF